MSPTQLPGLAPLARSPTNPGRARSGPPSPPPCCHQPGRRHRRPLPGGTPDPAAPRRTATASPAGPPGRRCRPRLPTTREARQEPAAEGWGAERAGSLRAAGGRTGVGGRTGREVTSQGGQGGGPGRAGAPRKPLTHILVEGVGGEERHRGAGGAARRGHPSRQRGGGATSPRRSSPSSPPPLLRRRLRPGPPRQPLSRSTLGNGPGPPPPNGPRRAAGHRGRQGPCGPFRG